MKKTLIYGLLGLMTFSSCSDFLEVNPSSNILESEYYNSEERIFKGLIAAYDPLQWPDWAMGQYNPLHLISDFMSDDLFPGGANAQDNEHWHRMHNFNATGEYTCGALWTVFYSGVNRANIVIEKMAGISNISAEKRNLYLAEAHVLRAYYYSWLWKLWGNVPYYSLNPTTPPYLVDQMGASDVYAQIVSDLDFALDGNKLPETVSAAWVGRVTAGVARMLKAEVVMYQNDQSRFNEVLNDMRTLINGGSYSLQDDFGQIWEDKGEWCSESIWEINYNDQNSQRSWSNPIACGGSVTPTLVGINGLRSKEFSGGWGFGTVNANLYNAYHDNDQRKNGGILSWAVYEAKWGADSVSYSPRFQDTGYFLKKYLPRQGGNKECTGDKDLNYRNNYRVYRLAEAYLNAAELIVRTGGSTAEAQQYLDQIRARAFRVTSDELGNHRVEATLDNILQERHLELALEGKRYWDLVRSEKAALVLGARGYSASKKYLPIPSSEIDKAHGTLVQNPY